MTRLAVFRRALLAVFILSVIAVAAELLLLGHVSGGYQKIPLVLLVMSLLVLAWGAVDRSPASHRAFRFTMLLFMMAGAAGIWFHARADAPAEPPALAPGTMIQLGVLGLLERWSRALGEHS